MKEKGILLPIFSLPSKYGIGDFGYEAYQFIDILSENNIKYWEVLPINECDRHPYSPISYYALEEDYISLDKLKEQGLIQKAETREKKGRAVYDNFKQKYYEEAFKNFKPDSEYEEFIKLKEMNEYAEFSSERSNYSKEYYLFLQYIAYKQWMELKQYAKILYEHLVHFVEERHLMNYSPLIAINNLYTNIDSLHYNEIGLVYGYLKQAIDLNFLVNLSQDTIMLKICKFCHKAFIPKNSKAEYDTPQCKNKANVYSFRKRAQED